MRLITRRDASLAVALIAAALIAFERPFRWLLDFVQELEHRYHIDLLPALLLLTGVFVFHQYAKRMQAKSEVASLAREIAHTRAHTQELERLMALSRSLADALDRHSLEQALWRALPEFIGQRECSILSRRPSGVEFLLRDVRMLQRHTSDSIEAVVGQAASIGIDQAAREGADVDGDIMFPMIAGGSAVGAVIVRNEPTLARQERLAIASAAALIAVATRNERLLDDARQSGVIDSLTGCVTRAHGLGVLDRELRRARRSGRPLSVIMFDIDHFKQINDGQGHLHGDGVLASVGAQVNKILRSTDTACRYGGDEFLLILPETPIVGAQHVAESVRCHITELSSGDGGQLHVTASLGVAAALAGEMDAKALIGRADEALYRAKRAGRNRWCATAVTPMPNANTEAALARATAS